MNPKIGITAGAFDLCHAGHMRSFRNAKVNCDFLVVALHVDPSVERPEKHKPIMTLTERLEILDGIKYIDQVIVYNTEKELLAILDGSSKLVGKPAVRFLGDDWRGKPYTGHELALPIIWENRSHGFSSSELRRRIAIAEMEAHPLVEQHV